MKKMQAPCFAALGAALHLLRTLDTEMKLSATVRFGLGIGCFVVSHTREGLWLGFCVLGCCDITHESFSTICWGYKVLPLERSYETVDAICHGQGTIVAGMTFCVL